MLQEEVTSRIKALYNDAELQVSGEGCSFQLQIVSTEFAGMRQLERQKTIMGLFREEITSGELHALTIKAKTPAEMSQEV